MDDSKTTIGSIDEAKQTGKGVQTPLEMTEAAQKLGEMLRLHPKRDRLDVVALRGLCLLTEERPEDAGDGFIAMDLAKAIRRVSTTHASWAHSDLFGPGGKVDENHEAISDKIREQWQRVEKLWATLAEGVPQKFKIDGYSWHPKPEREIGGGTGRPTKYRLAQVNIEQTEADVVAIDDPVNETKTKNTNQETVVNSPNFVQYWCEEVEDAGWLAKQFSNAWSANTGNNHWMIWFSIASIIAMTVYSILVILSINHASNSTDILKIILIHPIVFWFFWRVLGPIMLVQRRRVVPAPSWLQSEHEDRLLEWRRIGERKAEVKLVRYVGTCPLCKGQLTIRGGGHLFTGRLYGACNESPQEHRFQFDHKLRHGQKLD